MPEEKMKNCPFCGGKAEIQVDRHYYHVGCMKCMVSMNDFNDEKDAIEAWNTRPSESVEEVIEKFDKDFPTIDSLHRNMFKDWLRAHLSPPRRLVKEEIKEAINDWLSCGESRLNPDDVDEIADSVCALQDKGGDNDKRG